MTWTRRLALGFGGAALLVAPNFSSAVASARSDPDSRRSTPSRIEWSDAARADALRRAAVWQPGDADAAARPDSPERTLSCRYSPDALGGTTPKFECVTEDGETIKVKYAGAEPHGEVAATTLLRRLGFPADRVGFVERVRCYGCPPFPFQTTRALDLVNGLEVYGRHVDYSKYREFEWPAVERKHPGTAIETRERRGWAWYELDTLRAPAAHVDGLRLVAVFLAHWDNKTENQRLVCLDGDPASLARERCSRPVALLQDLGGTFGPRKVDLAHWRRTPIWSDRGSCLVSMEGMPHGGGTFEPVRISEAGRRFLGSRLASIGRHEIRELFDTARFAQYDGQDVENWVDAFQDKVRQVTDGPPCPAR